MDIKELKNTSSPVSSSEWKHIEGEQKCWLMVAADSDIVVGER